MSGQEYKYAYTVIIPHKNIPDLLERCLGSIPQRPDIQVIIVDDNSDPTIVDFARFPGLNRPDTKVIFHKAPVNRGGAGVARNVGMAEAEGRWLVFADADDFFHPTASAMFDKYHDSDADIIFFRHDSADCYSLEPVKINTTRTRLLEEYDNTGDDTPLRYMIWVPWAKFIRQSLVTANGITFDEVRFSNNLMFSVRTGHLATKIISDTTILYCNTRREGSLIHEGRKDWEAMSQRFDVDYRAARFILEAGRGYIFDVVVSERWKSLWYLDRRKARRLIPNLKEACSRGQVRQIRFELFVERLIKPIITFLEKRRMARHDQP